MYKITIIGTGYVGLVTGTCFAEMGNTVYCVDIIEPKINQLNADIIPIYEPNLKELVIKNKKENRLFFTTDIENSIKQSLICFIAVGTPPLEDGSADISQVLNVANAIGRLMNKHLIVINKSTVPIGTAEKVRETIQSELDRRQEKLTFSVVSNPEFLKEGAAIEDFMNPDRIVIGTDDVKVTETMKQLYKPIVSNNNPIIFMDIKSAELTKYAANAMLALRISFMNEIAQLCDRVGADIIKVKDGIGTDQRIGMGFLNAGLGYGGSCFPKDVKELISIGNKQGVEMEIVKAVEQVNMQQKHYFLEMIYKRFGNDLTGMLFGIWGLSFKPQTDDMREAPSKVIVSSLIERGARLIVYDPVAMDEARKIFDEMKRSIQYANDMMGAVTGVGVLLLITEWEEFKQVDVNELKNKMKTSIVFDGRNQFDPIMMKEKGIEYYCIGRN